MGNWGTSPRRQFIFSPVNFRATRSLTFVTVRLLLQTHCNLYPVTVAPSCCHRIQSRAAAVIQSRLHDLCQCIISCHSFRQGGYAIVVVCLSACLFVSNLRENVLTDLHEIIREVLQCAPPMNNNWLNFGDDPDHGFGSGDGSGSRHW